MTLLNEKPSAEPAPFELKGSLFALTVMHLRPAALEAVDRHLSDKIGQAPGFFSNAPVVVDLEAFPDDAAAPDFEALFGCLRRHGLVPVGVRNGAPALTETAARAGIAVLPEGRAPRRPETDKADKPEAARSRIVTHPVRSGQQIYVPDGDLVLVGPVSPGAEVLADGSIHVYGPLRGRALAGARGNAEGRIFCLSLEAELVSVAGRYRMLDKDDTELWGKPAQIHLVDDHLIIEPLPR